MPDANKNPQDPTRSSERNGIVARRLIAVVLVLVLLGAIGFIAHGYRKKRAIKVARQSGIAAYEAKDYREAGAHLERYLLADPTHVEIRWKYADAQLRTRPQSEKRIEKALVALEAILRLDPDHADAAERLGQLYLLINRPVEAERICRGRLEASPGDEPSVRRLAAALIAQRKYDEAIEILTEFAGDRPDRVEVRRSLAFLLLRHKNDAEGCLKLLTESVQQNPKSAAARLALARFYLATDQKPLAMDELAEAERLGSDESAVLLDLGRILSALGFQQRADAQFELAERAAPADPAVYRTRSQTALDTGRFEAGAACADRALAALQREDRYDYLPLAVELYAAANQTERARTGIEELRASGASLDLLSYFEGRVLLADDKPRDSVAVLGPLVRRKPDYAKAHLVLGRAYAASGQSRRATQALREYIRLTSGSTLAAQVELARIHADLGQWTEAEKAAEEAVRQAPQSLLAELTWLEIRASVSGPHGAKPDADTLQRLYRQTQALVTKYPPEARVRILLARLAAAQGQWQDGCEILLAARSDLEPAGRLTLALVDILTDAGESERALAECEKALASADGLEVAQLKARRAAIRAGRGDDAQAREQIASLADETTGSTRSTALRQLARILFRQGKKTLARECLLRVVAEDSGDLSSRVRLLSLEDGPSQAASRQQWIDELRHIEGEDGLNYQYWQARLWLDSDDRGEHRSEIKTFLKACLSTAPGWAEAALALGWIHEETQEFAEAMEVYQQALRSNPRHIPLARSFLRLAIRARRWGQMRRTLDVLPQDDQRLEEYRIALALHDGDTALAIQLLERRVNADEADFISRLRLAVLFRRSHEPTKADALLAEAARIAPEAPPVLLARAEAKRVAADWPEALKLCDQVLAQGADPRAYELRARVHEAQGDLKAAENDFQEITRLSDVQEAGYLRLGQFYATHGRLDEAIALWQQGLEAVPDSLQISVGMMSALFADGDEAQREAATKMLDKLLADRPQDETLLMLRADRLREEDPAEAERIYRELAEKDRGDVDALLRLAQMAAERGYRAQALELVDRGLSRDDKNVDLLLIKSNLLMANSPHRAVVAAKQALDLRPNSERAVLALAKARTRSGDRGKAVEALTDFLKRAPSPPATEAKLFLAKLYLLDSQFAQADALIRQVSELAPGSSGAVQTRLLWHRAQDHWDEIVALSSEYQGAHPEDVETARLAARFLIASPDVGRREAAKVLFERIVEQRPSDADSFADFGGARYRLGQIAEARSAFEAGLEVDPDNVRLLNDLAWLLCEDQEDPQAAEPRAARAVEKEPDNPIVLDTWGVVQYRLGNEEPSREALEKCLASVSVRPATKLASKFHLARTLSKSNPSRSRELLQEVFADTAHEIVLSPTDRREASQLQKSLEATAP